MQGKKWSGKNDAGPAALDYSALFTFSSFHDTKGRTEAILISFTVNIRCHSSILRRHVQVCDNLLNNAERIGASLFDMKSNYRYCLYL